ncbi:MAG: Holliday junction branch migration protein RuvA [Patescibacteria group bacterium]
MISYLEGPVVFHNDKYISILAGGVGYKVFMAADALAKAPVPGETARVFTHFHVRDDALEIYGFLHQAELELFELLLSVSGVGPKVALTIVGLDRPAVLAGAIVRGDDEFFTKVSGIGRKTAQKIIVELKEKIAKSGVATEDADASLDADAIDALVGLGWNVRDARAALKRVPKTVAQTELRIKEALKALGK